MSLSTSSQPCNLSDLPVRDGTSQPQGSHTCTPTPRPDDAQGGPRSPGRVLAAPRSQSVLRWTLWTRTRQTSQGSSVSTRPRHALSGGSASGGDNVPFRV